MIDTRRYSEMFLTIDKKRRKNYRVVSIYAQGKRELYMADCPNDLP